MGIQELTNNREQMSRLFEGILLLSDLDGTLLDTHKLIPERNIDAIQRFTAGGGLFSISTGRCPESALRVARVAGANCPGVTLNGTVIYDFDKDTAVFRKFLPEGYRKLVQCVHRAFPEVGIQVYESSNVYVVVSSDVVEGMYIREAIERKEAAIDNLPERINKVLFGGTTERLKEISDFLEGVDMPGMYGMFTESFYYEILPSHTNKGTGVQAIAQHCGIKPQNVAAVGDYYNDVDMLRSVAFPIAAGNAPDEVKQCAKFVTGDCDHGVIADAIDCIERRLRRSGVLE